MLWIRQFCQILVAPFCRRSSSARCTMFKSYNISNKSALLRKELVSSGRKHTSLNPSPPSAAYMRQWTGSSLIQVMACRLFGAAITWTNAGLLSVRLLGTYFSEIWIEFYHFQSRKCNLKCRLPKLRSFCPGGDELIILISFLSLTLIQAAGWMACVCSSAVITVTS